MTHKTKAARGADDTGAAGDKSGGRGFVSVSILPQTRTDGKTSRPFSPGLSLLLDDAIARAEAHNEAAAYHIGMANHHNEKARRARLTAEALMFAASWDGGQE